MVTRRACAPSPARSARSSARGAPSCQLRPPRDLRATHLARDARRRASRARPIGADPEAARPARVERRALRRLRLGSASGCEALGLEVEVDAAGNLIGRWQAGRGRPCSSARISTPSRGRARSTARSASSERCTRSRRCSAQGFAPARPVWIVAFMDEEGTRFGASLFGSRAFAGDDVTRLAPARRCAGTTLARGDAGARLRHRAGRRAARVARRARLPRAPHRAGPRAGGAGEGRRRRHLDRRPAPLPAPAAGQANHAGTTPMVLRRDAFAGAARIALELRDFARARRGVTVNVGTVDVTPGGVERRPRRRRDRDRRPGTDARRRRGARAAGRRARRRASPARRGWSWSWSRRFSLEPLELDSALVDARRARGRRRRAPTSRRLPSGAGHDAMVIGRHVPAAMIFVPSAGGISHSPAEHTASDELELGVRVLAGALEQLLL